MNLRFADADAHVEECSDTWDYFPKSKSDLRPVEMNFGEDQPSYLKMPRRGLFIDGLIFQQFIRDELTTQTSNAERELRDVPARVKQMDELNIDVQIMYPSLFLYEVTRRPELEVALCESYNRWIADRSKESGGRLQWVATLPLRSMPDALLELRRAKEDGAVGVLKRSYECDDRRAGDQYFDPIYELAQELDMPICIHTTRPYVGFHNSFSKLQIGIHSAGYLLDSFLSILMDGVTKRFPELRVGFIEAGSGWLPYALWMTSYASRFTNERADDTTLRSRAEQVMEENRLFVTCESTEDLPDIIGHVGDDHIGVGTDYGHHDRSSVREAHQAIVDRIDISKESIEKLTGTNARLFYGIK